jgi:hypothetical protein
VSKEKIALDVSEWARNPLPEKIKKYSANYPKTVQEITNLVIR